MGQLVTLLGLLTFIVGLTLGILVFSRSPKDHLFQAFGVTVMGMVGWNLTIFLLLTEIGPPLIPGRLAFSFVSLIAVGLAMIALLFPRPVRGIKYWMVANVVLGLVFFIMPLLPSWLTWIKIVDGHITGDLNFQLFGYWTIHYVAVLLVAFFFLIYRMFKEKGVDRQRLKQIIFGYALFLFPMLLTQVLLPLFFQDYRFNNFGPLFTIFLVTILGYAIANYRLLDIKWILGRSVFFSIIIGGVLWIVTSTAFLVSDLLDSKIALIAGALLVAVFFEPLWHFLERIFLKIVHSGSYNPEESREELFELVRDEGELSVLIETLVKKFAIYFSAIEVEMMVLNAKSGKVVGSFSKGFETAHVKSASKLRKIVHQNKGQIVELSELEWMDEYGKKVKRGTKSTISEMKKLGIKTIVPFTVDSRTVGLMIFGERRFDKALKNGDIKFLNFVRSGISPALENAAKFEEIKKLYKDLSALDQAKSEFIDVVSHRFRTPLSAIRWNLEIVLDSAGKRLTKDMKQSLLDVHDRSLFLVSTLDRLFETLAIESGKYSIKRAEFDAFKAFTDVAEKYKPACKEKNIKCSVEIEKMTVNGDQAKLTQLVTSLLKNALQYTSEGGNIKFKVSEDEKNIILIVEDDGIGIPDKALDKMWEKFFRAKNAILTYADGQGLGLFFVKKIVDLHGGKIKVETAVNKGTRFTITIPKKVKKKKVKK